MGDLDLIRLEQLDNINVLYNFRPHNSRCHQLLCQFSPYLDHPVAPNVYNPLFHSFNCSQLPERSVWTLIHHLGLHNTVFRRVLDMTAVGQPGDWVCVADDRAGCRMRRDLLCIECAF